MGIVPAAGHMVHMPGHIWLALGDFNNAVAVNERAVEVDRKYVAEEGLMGGYGMYVLHNMQFLVYGHAMQGSAAETRKAARQMSAAIQEHAAEMGEMADVMNSWLTLNELRGNLWDDILKSPQPKAPPSLAVLAFVARGGAGGQGTDGGSAQGASRVREGCGKRSTATCSGTRIISAT